MATGDLFEGEAARVRVVFTFPVDLGTSEAPKVCRGSDGCDYVVKDGSTHAAIPHSEWFCSQLGERVGIAAPVHRIMDIGGGATAFGSRWLGGSLTPDGATPWFGMVETGDLSLSDMSSALSRIYAFDHFVQNLDRNLTNLLLTPQFQGHAVVAFDYSQAWLCWGFPLNMPPLPLCRTVEVQRFLSCLWKSDYISASIVRETCDTIASVTIDTVENIMRAHPQDWLNDAQREAIVSWWGSDDMTLRLGRIVEGVENGSCL